MKPISNKLVFLLILSITASMFTSCEKDDDNKPIPDYRDTYTGNFRFTIISETWGFGGNHGYDTSYTTGSIGLFRQNKILIKYINQSVHALYSKDTLNCNSVMGFYLSDTTISNPPPVINGYYFTDYYQNWASPEIVEDTLQFRCVPFRLSSGFHEAFGGYFTGNDSLYLFYSSGGLGGGNYMYIYGSRVE